MYLFFFFKHNNNNKIKIVVKINLQKKIAQTISSTKDTIIILQTIRSTNTSNCHYSLTPTINYKKKKINLNWKFGPEGKKRAGKHFVLPCFLGFSSWRREENQ